MIAIAIFSRLVPYITPTTLSTVSRCYIVVYLSRVRVNLRHDLRLDTLYTNKSREPRETRVGIETTDMIFFYFYFYDSYYYYYYYGYRTDAVRAKYTAFFFSRRVSFDTT